MPNPYKNKVVYGNEVIIDITDTTATQSDVARGKYFYLASGQRVEGTSSGSGGMVVIETEDSHGGTVVEITGDAVRLQQKNVTPSTSQQTVAPDSGYNGLSQVVVSAIPGEYIIPTGMKSITENGTGIDVRQYATVDVNVSGGVDAPVFTVTWDANWKEILSVTCNKTYSECVSYFDQGISCALTNETNGVEEYSYAAELMSMGSLGAPITYSLFDDHGPLYDIVFNPNGSIEAISPSAYNKTLNATKNGTYYPSGGVYTSVNVAVPPTVPTLQEKTATPTEQVQEIVADQGYDGLSSVEVGAISSNYVGSGITRRSSTDLTVSGATVTAPSGFYSSEASVPVASGTAGTPTATKGSVSGHSVTVTPSVTNVTGYISGGTLTGTGVSVSASELVSGKKTISANGMGIDVTNYAEVDVSVTPSLEAKTGITPTESSQTISPSSGYDGLSSVQVDAISSTYVGSDIARRSSADLTASGATVSVPSGYYESGASKAVASGSATTPATTVTANPSISVNSSGLITATASATKSVTPSVSAGYVSSGTAGTITVSGSNTSQLSTQAATTITPTKSSQTAVAAGKYTTGAVTVAAIPAAYQDVTGVTATAADVVSGKDIVNSSGTLVHGSLVIQHYYTGSGAPSSSLGVNGDIYLDTGV